MTHIIEALEIGLPRAYCTPLHLGVGVLCEASRASLVLHCTILDAFVPSILSPS